jgi:hypothetical protein
MHGRRTAPISAARRPASSPRAISPGEQERAASVA